MLMKNLDVNNSMTDASNATVEPKTQRKRPSSRGAPVKHETNHQHARTHKSGAPASRNRESERTATGQAETTLFELTSPWGYPA